MARFSDWRPPEFDERGMTRWNWMCQWPDRATFGAGCDIGAFTYINAKAGVRIGRDAQVGSHCSLYSVSTIDGREGPVVLEDEACLGSHTTVMPGVTIGRGSIVGAHSLVLHDIPAGVVAFGVPARVVRPRDAGGAPGALASKG